MARDISIMDMLSSASKAAVVEDIVEKISVADIQPNQDNFYELRDMEQLKSAIYAMGGVQQNIVVSRLPEGEKFKYKLLAGHRRTLACVELVQEGHNEFAMIPAVIKNNPDADEEEMLLLMTNSTQRELSDYEKVMQHMKLKRLIPKLKRRDNIGGRVRTLEAEFMNVSEAQIGIYNTIGTRLEDDLLELFAKGVIGISLAYEIAKLASVDQIKLIDVYEINGKLIEDDVKQLLYSKPLEGQVKVEDIVTEDIVTEDIETTVTFEMDAPEETISFDIEPEENVSESDTFESKPITANNQICYYSSSESDIGLALSCIFDNDFPEEVMNEIRAIYAETEINPEISAERIFNRILPYENHSIKVSRQGGYKIELKYLNDSYIIPTYPFWKGFADTYKLKPQKNVSESDTFETVSAADINVSESDTSDKQTAVEQAYTVDDIQYEIEKYEGYLKQLDKDKFQAAYKRYSMTRDALQLLLDSMR